MAADSASPAPIRKFHLSLNVSDLHKSVAFYQVLFGTPAAKHHADYAKFEVVSPPAVISLVPGRSGSGGALNHVGLCLSDSEELVAIQKRLEEAGHHTLREDGVACCYSRQTKFWVRDPDGVLLELYVFHEDLEEHGEGHVPEEDLPPAMDLDSPKEADGPAATWTHRLGDILDLPLPLSDNSLQEIILEGTLNASPQSLDLAAVLREARRALKPGGKAILHGLAADRPLTQASPSLPGPAAAVQHVPDFPALPPLLTMAGLSEIRFLKLSERGYFEVEGVPLREVLLEAVKPGFRASKKDQTVVYAGPLSAVKDDHGNRYAKGQPVQVNRHDWQALQAGTAGHAFFQLQPAHLPDGETGCCKS